MSTFNPVTPRFDGRVALVTGASSGIGRASAMAFARAGAQVVVADIDHSGGAKTVDLIEEMGGEAHFIATDVRHDDQVESLLHETVERFDRLDFAHNNAGVMRGLISLDECPEDLWDSIIDVNLKGMWLCLKYELRWMREQQHGSIVNTSSVLGLRGHAGSGPYVASKHGVIGLTRVAALECALDGIRVNAVCPSWIRTPPIDRMFTMLPDLEGHLTESEPVGRLGTPEEVADTVVWLCSDSASFITGHALVVDGGLSI